MALVKSPLNVYIIWHPQFARGTDYANFLYSEFCRNYQKPLSRGIGIPVFFRSEPFENNKPIDIDFGAADKNAVIVLVEDEIFQDHVFTAYFKEVAGYASANSRIFPVALSRYAYDVAPEIKEQFIRLEKTTDANETMEFEKRCNKLKSELLHDLSRLLLNMSCAQEKTKEESTPPVKLFISHAKKDGENIAMDFRNYIRTETKLNSFFDANDIANGYDFEDEIAAGVKNSAMVVFQTDEYSSREWCRIEVITAKRYKSPIVIVNAINSGEKRSFPYIGNTPTIRWNNNFDDIIDLALEQMLYNLNCEQVMKKMEELYLQEAEGHVIRFTSPPELFNFLDITKFKKTKNNQPVLVMYPDPPLGNEELRLLNEIDENITFITPIMLPKLVYYDR